MRGELHFVMWGALYFVMWGDDKKVYIFSFGLLEECSRYLFAIFLLLF
jgi:hypothetical protein